MRRLLCAVVALCALATASSASALPDQHVRVIPAAIANQYEALRQQVHVDTAWSPGRDILKDNPTVTRVRSAIQQLDADIANPEPEVLTPVTSSSGVLSASAAPAGGGGLAACVANRESTMNPQAASGPYMSYFQWDQNTWQAAGGTRYSATPYGASYGVQAQLFTNYYPSHPSAWPNTLPACGGP